MGRIFFGIAAAFFFFAAIGVTVIPQPTAWGLVCLALGLASGAWTWTPWKRTA